MQYKLDNSKSKIMQVSNDACYYLLYGDEPLDDENLEEAKEIESMFPNGYVVSSWEPLDDEPGMVEIVIVPYVQDNTHYDGQIEYVAKNWVLKYTLISANTVHVIITNEITGEVRREFDCRVVLFDNKEWIVFNSEGDASHLSKWTNCTQIPIFKCK